MSHIYERIAQTGKDDRRNKSVPKSTDMSDNPIRDPKLLGFTLKTGPNKNEPSLIRNQSSFLSSTKAPLNSTMEESLVDDASNEISSPSRRRSTSRRQVSDRVNQSRSKSRLHDSDDLFDSSMDSSRNRTYVRDPADVLITSLNDTKLEGILEVVHSEEEKIEKFEAYYDCYKQVDDVIDEENLQTLIIRSNLDKATLIKDIVMQNEALIMINEKRHHFVQLALFDIEACKKIKKSQSMTPKLLRVVEKLEKLVHKIFKKLTDTIIELIEHLDVSVKNFYQSRHVFVMQMKIFIEIQTCASSTPINEAKHNSNAKHHRNRLDYKFALAKYFNELRSSTPLFDIVPRILSQFDQHKNDFILLCGDEFFAFGLMK